MYNMENVATTARVVMMRLTPFTLETQTVIGFGAFYDRKKKIAKAEVHSPVSTESWSIEYTSHIKGLIETTLTKLGVVYFFALTVLPIGSIETPVIVILTDAAENIDLVHKCIEKIVRNNKT
jgi:hypothetical protein